MAIADNDIIKAVWQARHSNPNTIIQNIFYYRLEDGLDFTEANVGADIINYLIETYATINITLSVRYVMEFVRVTNETKKEFIFQGAQAGFAGTEGASEVLPAQDSVQIVARSRQLGKPGRKYLGPLVETAVDNGVLNIVAKPLYADFLARYDNTFAGGVTGNTYRPGTVSFLPGGGVGQYTAFVQGLGTVYDDMRTQRRRRPRVGLS